MFSVAIATESFIGMNVKNDYTFARYDGASELSALLMRKMPGAVPG